jgi:tetratricopeptide (TPR) repeat protein
MMDKVLLAKAFLLSVLIGLYPIGADRLSPQKVSTRVSVQNDIFLTDSGLLPLPDQAIELERESTIRSECFRSPLKMACDLQGNLYTSSIGHHAVCQFNAAGEFQISLGSNEAGDRGLQGPYQIVAVRDYLIIHETKRERLEFLDYRGHHLRNRKIPDFHDFVSDGNGGLYIAPYVEGKDSPLVQVYWPDGKEFAFGKPLAFHHSMTSLNSRSLAMNDKGEVFVAFTYFPIVRKYSSTGTLLAEWRIANPVMEAKEKYNLKMIGAGITSVSQRAGYMDLIVDIKAFADKIYLLSHIPRLEITEMDGDGRYLSTYWMDYQEVYSANDFVIRDSAGEKRFYVSRSFGPPYDIDVYKKKARSQGGLGAEIEELTKEIAANPNDFPGYNNRGAARHRSGDFKGAIEDFSKAIELAPSSPLAYNNRGLSRVKIQDLDGAISDFTKSVGLDPKMAAAFFNRGIARVRKSEFKNAIEDFEAAAQIDPAFKSKALEQIIYCRGRLRKN